MVKNKGYSLVELVIVIAIMAILAVASLGSIIIIKKAKFSEAVNTLNNQMSRCLVRTKATSAVQNKQLCMVILKRDDSRYVVMTGYKGSSGVLDSDGNTITSSGTYADEKCEAVLPKEVVAIYYGTDPNPTAEVSLQSIQFVKSDGSVADGGGYYTLKSKTGDTKTIYLDKISGKHYIQ